MRNPRQRFTANRGFRIDTGLWAWKRFAGRLQSIPGGGSNSPQVHQKLSEAPLRRHPTWLLYTAMVRRSTSNRWHPVDGYGRLEG
jgi:hypothetical protein